MRKIICGLLIFLSLNFLAANVVSAEENNKFGIHIIDEHDLKDAAALVNSNGGEWGYVTFVIREDQRDQEQWQRAMDEMRRLKLIPIVRLATKMENSYWTIPTEAEATNWAGFLNSLNWPTKTRYIVLFNEPNHAKEWGGKIDPAGFAKTYRHYYETMKSFSSDFFILPAALDLAAPNSSTTMDASTYFQRMHQEDNYIFTIYDGLNSHSYPNPGFSGKVTDSGKTSIHGYKWELSFLQNYGLRPDVPVFITETGWINGAGDLEENYKYAFENVWSDPQIKAVTPFVLNYLEKPFDGFSWRDPATKAFHPQYYSVQGITKTKGAPAQTHSFELIKNNIAEYLVSDSEYLFTIELKNTGQSIWSKDDGFKVEASSTMKDENIVVGDVPTTEPNQTAKISIRLITNEPRGIHTIKLSLAKNSLTIGEIGESKFTLVSPPSLNIFATFWLGGDDNFANLKIYDDTELVSSFDNLAFKDGMVTIPTLKNVIPNRDYRLVLSKPFFIPSTANTTLYTGVVDVYFGILVPIDLNADNKLNLNDLVAHITNPLNTAVKLLGI